MEFASVVFVIFPSYQVYRITLYLCWTMIEPSQHQQSTGTKQQQRDLYDVITMLMNCVTT